MSSNSLFFGSIESSVSSEAPRRLNDSINKDLIKWSSDPLDYVHENEQVVSPSPYSLEDIFIPPLDDWEERCARAQEEWEKLGGGRAVHGPIEYLDWFIEQQFAGSLPAREFSSEPKKLRRKSSFCFDRETHITKHISSKKSRRSGRMLRRIAKELLFFSLESGLPTPEFMSFDQYSDPVDDVRVLFQCNPICSAAEEDVQVDIPHNELAYMEMTQLSSFVLRDVHTLYHNVIGEIPKQIGEYYTRRQFCRLFSVAVYQGWDSVKNLCNAPLIISQSEVDFHVNRAGYSASAYQHRDAGLNAIFLTFRGVAKVIHLEAIARTTVWTEDCVSSFEDLCVDFLGAAGRSFVVSTVPTEYREAVVTLFMRYTVCLGTLRFRLSEATYEFDDTIFDKIDELVDHAREQYRDFMNNVSVRFQTGAPGSFPEYNGESSDGPPGIIETVTDFVDKVSKFGANVSSAAENTNELTGVLLDLSHKVNTDYDGMKSLFDKFLSPFQNLTVSDIMETLAYKVLPIVMLVILAYKMRGWIVKIVYTLFLFAIGYCGTEVLKALGNKFMALTLSSPIEERSVVDESEDEEEMVSFQSGLGSLKDFLEILRPILNLKQMDFDDPLDSLVDTFSDLSPFVADGNKVLFIATKAADWWEKVKKFVGWSKTDLSQFCSGFDDVDDFAKRCSILFAADGVMPTASNKAELTALYNLSVHLRNKYANKRNVSDILRDFLPRLLKLKSEVDAVTRSGLGYRIEPTTLFLVSAPGLGKTTAMEIINSRLIQESLKHRKELVDLYEANPKEFIHTRANSPYWEGLTPYCLAVYYADYLSAKSESIGSSHEAEIIDLVSCQQYTPNMAFEKKGKIDLRPDWVTGSTNESKIRGETINHPGAVARRMNLVKLVWKGPGEKPVPGMRIDPDHWRFQVMKIDANFAFREDTSYPLLTIDDVINLTVIRREMDVRKMAKLRLTMQDQKVNYQKTSAIQRLAFDEGEDAFAILKKLNEVQFQTREPKGLALVSKILMASTAERKILILTHMDELRELFVQRGLRMSIPVPVLQKGFEFHIKNNPEEVLKLIMDEDATISAFSSLGAYKIDEPSPGYGVTIVNLLKSLSADTLINIASAIIGAAAGFVYLYWNSGTSQEVDPIPPPVQEQTKTYLDMKALKAKQKKDKRVQRIKLQRVGETPVHFQSSEAVSVALNKAKYHTFQLYSSGVEVQNIVAVGDRVFFVNHHFYLRMKEAIKEQGLTEKETVLYAKNADRPEVAPFKILVSEIADGVLDPASDVIFFVASHAPESRSILPHWADDKFILDKASSQSVSSGVGAYLRSAKGPQYSDSARLVNGRHMVGPDGESRFYRQLWRMSINSQEGDCGSLYFSTSNDMGQAGKFIGFHAMGNRGFGPVYACAVTKTTLDQAIRQLLGQHVEADPGDRDVIGDGPMRHRFETKVTDVRVPSEHVAYEARQAPAPVNDPEAYYKISAKYNKNKPLSKPLQEKLRTSIKEVLKDWERKQDFGMHTGFLDLHEAIVGIPGTSFDGIDLTTSAGYPHNCLGNTKHMLMGQYEEGELAVGPKAELTVDEVDLHLHMLAAGVVPMWVYTDVTKAELLPKEKVAKGKVRLVSAAPNSCVLITRMLFGNFTRWVKDNCLSNGVEMTNQEGPDADTIARMHMTIAAGLDSHIAGDLSAYDTRHSAEALRIALECIVDFILTYNKGASPDVVNMLRTYTHSLSNTYHIRGSTFHRWLGSLPSGHPLTTILNSVLNQAYFGYSVWKATNFKLDFWPWYFQNFILRVLGDDNRASCSPEGRDYVSESICSSGYADFGHVYTNDEKNGINDEFRPFHKTSLLKRYTRYEPLLGKYIAPLRIDVIEELPLWTRGEGQDLIPSIPQALQNLNTAVKYLSYHPDSEWDRLIPLWEKMYEEYGWRCPYVDRASCLFATYGSQRITVA